MPVVNLHENTGELELGGDDFYEQSLSAFPRALPKFRRWQRTDGSRATRDKGVTARALCALSKFARNSDMYCIIHTNGSSAFFNERAPMFRELNSRAQVRTRVCVHDRFTPLTRSANGATGNVCSALAFPIARLDE